MSESYISLPEKSNLAFPTLALAVKAQGLPELYRWAIANSFALEYTPDPAIASELSQEQASTGIPAYLAATLFEWIDDGFF